MSLCHWLHDKSNGSEKCLHDVRVNVTITLHAGNMGANFLATNQQLNERRKHIDIHFHKIHEDINNRSFTLLKVASSDTLADICTTILAKPVHVRLMGLLGCR